MTDNLFEQAVRNKYRFTTSKGELTVEDLFDLPLTTVGQRVSLDSVACDLYRELREAQEVSFVTEKTKTREILENKFALVKYIIDVRLLEKKKQEQKLINKEKLERIDEVLRFKEEEDLRNKSVEDLKKMREELQG